jgi:hypothetical protein
MYIEDALERFVEMLNARERSSCKRRRTSTPSSVCGEGPRCVATTVCPAWVQAASDVKIRNKRSFQTRKRVQRKLATRKAQRQDTHSVRRLLKQLGRKRSNRTHTFAQTAAKQLVS